MNFDSSYPETPWSRRSGSSTPTTLSSTSTTTPTPATMSSTQSQSQPYPRPSTYENEHVSQPGSSPECALYLQPNYIQIIHDISLISPLQNVTSLCGACLSISRDAVCHVCHTRNNCSANFGLITVHATIAREYLGMIGHADQMHGIEQQPLWETEYGTSDDIDARNQYAKVLSYILTQHILGNKSLGLVNSSIQDFDCAQGSFPSVSLYDYILRLMRYAPATKELYVATLILIDRIIAMNPGMIVTERNVHRLLAASILVASKFFDDLFYTNKFFADVACIDVNELNNLEICFLVHIKFGLCIKKELFVAYVKPFEQIVAFAKTNDDLFRFYSIVYNSYREKVIEQILHQLQRQCVNQNY